MYIIDKKKYLSNTSIKKQASKKYLYGNNDDLENQLMEIEHESSIIVNRVIKDKQLPSVGSKEHYYLLSWMLISGARNLETAEHQKDAIRVALEEMQRVSEGQPLEEKMVTEMQDEMSVPNYVPIRMAIQQVPFVLDLKSILIVNSTDRSFLLSDNPLVKFNQFSIERKYYERGYGIGNVGIQLFFPITDKLCVCLFDSNTYTFSGTQNSLLDISKGKIIDEMNKLSYLSSYKYVFFRQTVLQTYIKFLSKTDKSKSRNKSVRVLRGHDGSSLIEMSTTKVQERIRLPFFRINQEMMSLELPDHMGGLLRPAVKSFL